MGQIDKTVAKKWLQTKLRQKVTGAREKRRGKRRRRIALRKSAGSKRRLARLINGKLTQKATQKITVVSAKRYNSAYKELREGKTPQKGFKKKYKKVH